MINLIATIIKKILPKSLLAFIKKMIFTIKLIMLPKIHQKAIDRIRNKDKIKVAFFLINVDTWKLDTLYWMFNNEDRFDAVIVLCPFVSKGIEFLKIELNKGKIYCENKKYNYLVAYDEINSVGIDVKKIINPDIIFFTNPNALTFSKLCISNYFNYLTCYIPYSFRIDTLYEYEFDNDLVNLTWINFYETSIHEKLAKKYARNNAYNVFVSGYPFMDNYKSKKSNELVWKPQSRRKKRIIWAPHWTIKGYQNTGLDWSCFLNYHEFILRIAEEYESKIQVAMKPHPFLKNTLSQPCLWGVNKTEKYFKKWQLLSNCQIVDGEYVNLFLESDAMIHDSGSFMVEYLALNKPVAYTLSQKNLNNRFNEFGNNVLAGHYLINSENELKEFIMNVIEEIDPLSSGRKNIIKQHNLNKDNLISETIIKHINGKLI